MSKRAFPWIQSVGRRSFLRGAGGATLALPYLDWLAPRASAQVAGGPRRFVLFLTSAGTDQDRMASGLERDFTFGPILEPLEPWRDKLLVVNGIDNKIWEDHTNVERDGHAPLYPSAMTANLGTHITDRNGNLLPRNQQETFNGRALGPSIDQVLGQRLRQMGQRGTINLGIGVEGRGVHQLVYEGTESPASFTGSPAEAFDTYLTDITPPDVRPAGPDPAAQQASIRHRAVLDGVLGSAHAFRRRLGIEDRPRLDRHLEKMNELIRRLDEIGSTPSDPLACDPSRPSGTPDGYFDEPGDQPRVIEPQFDIGVRALTCGVASAVTFMTNTMNEALNFLPEIGQWHNDVHAQRALPGFVWCGEQFAKLLQRLENEEEDGGTMLDHTLVLWMSEYGNGGEHEGKRLHIVLAGTVGGTLGMGRYVKYGDGGRNSSSPYSHNQFFVTLLQAFGFDDQRFGWHDPFPEGPVPNILS